MASSNNDHCPYPSSPPISSAQSPRPTEPPQLIVVASNDSSEDSTEEMSISNASTDDNAAHDREDRSPVVANDFGKTGRPAVFKDNHTNTQSSPTRHTGQMITSAVSEPPPSTNRRVLEVDKGRKRKHEWQTVDDNSKRQRHTPSTRGRVSVVNCGDAAHRGRLWDLLWRNCDLGFVVFDRLLRHEHSQQTMEIILEQNPIILEAFERQVEGPGAE